MLDPLTSSIDRNASERRLRKLNNFDGVVGDGERRMRLNDNKNFAIFFGLQQKLDCFGDWKA